MRGQPILFYLLICFFYLLYHNITSWTSPKITLVLLFITCFLWNGILFLPWEIVIWPKPNKSDCLLWPTYYSRYTHLKVRQYLILTTIMKVQEHITIVMNVIKIMCRKVSYCNGCVILQQIYLRTVEKKMYFNIQVSGQDCHVTRHWLH